MSDTGYDAFISYRRSDGAAVARWLRRELEGFRPPRALAERYPQKLRIYLDTAYERGTSDFYEESIRPALLASRFLLVLATPHAVQRATGDDWIAREVADFAAGPNGRNVVAIRAAGEFHDPLPADLVERFPQIEIVDLRRAGRLWFLNPVRAARLASEKLKLVAPLIGLLPGEMPLLRQEEERRQQSRLGSVVGVTSAVVLAVGALSVFALQSRQRAVRALDDSIFVAERIVRDIAREVSTSGDQGKVRANLLNGGCDLLDKLETEAGKPPDVAVTVECLWERARSREELKEFDLAKAHYDKAIALALASEAQRPSAGQTVIAAREALANYHQRRGAPDDAGAEFERIREDAARLQAQFASLPGFESAVREFRANEAEALGSLGDLARAKNQRQLAADRYEAAALLVAGLTEGATTPGKPLLLWLARLERLAGEQLYAAKNLPRASHHFVRALAAADRISAGQPDPAVDIEMGRALAYVYAIEHGAGRLEPATRAFARARSVLAAVNSASTASLGQKRAAAEIDNWISAIDPAIIPP